MRVAIIILYLYFLSAGQAAGQAITEGYPFDMPAFDSIYSEYLPGFEGGVINDFISADQSGHFISNGKPLKFWGVNLTTGANFPVKKEAAKVAARMQKLVTDYDDTVTSYDVSVLRGAFI